jgi:phosphoribosylanthranilate isomerase
MSFPLQELFIKICGITNLADAEIACSLGANAIGFNFTKSNERYITPELAASISAKLPEYISKIGVFENVDYRSIQNILKLVPLSAVQLQGNYGSDDLIGYETSVIKAFLLDQLFDVEVLRNYLVDAFLLGSKNEDQIGLRPREYHWDIALKAKEYGRIILSGELNPENVEDAIRFVQPYGIDVCVGVEMKIGKKDPTKMRDFISRARNIILLHNLDSEDVDD